MADEIASLSMRIDSRQVEEANKALDEFEKKGNAAAKAADNFQKVTGKGPSGNAGQAAQKEASAFEKASAALEKYGVSTRVVQRMADRAKVSFAEMAARVLAAKGVTMEAAGALDSAGKAAGKTADELSDTSGEMDIAARAARKIVEALGEQGVTGVSEEAVAAMIRQRAVVLLLGGAFVAVGSAIAAAASYSLYSWNEARKTIEIALHGIGAASGITVDEINEVAFASSRMGGMSVSATRDAALSFVRMGIIAKENIGPATKQVENLALTMGMDIPSASKMYAEALASGVKGADELNKRLGFLNDRNRTLIQSLTEQGRYGEAQRIMIEGVSQSIATASDYVGFFTQSWNVAKNSVLNSIEYIGRGLSWLTGIGEATETKMRRDLEDLKAQRDALGKDGISPFSGLRIPGSVIDDIEKNIAELETKLKNAADQAQRLRDNYISLQAADVVRRLAPEVPAGTQAQNDIAILQKLRDEAMATMNQFEGTFDPRVVSKWDEAIARANVRLRLMNTTAGEFEQMQLRVQNLSIGAFSPSQRGQVAFEQQRLQFLTRGIDIYGRTKESVDSLAAAEMARTNAIKAASITLSEAARERELQYRQESENAAVELKVIGLTAIEQDRVRQSVQARHQVEQEAARNRTTVDQQHISNLQRQIDLQAELRRQAAELKLLDDLAFERAQLFRTEIEQTIASRQRAAGLAVDFNNATAAAIRMNEALRTAKDLASDFAVGFAKDLAHGISLTQALGNALTRFADKLIEMAVNDLVTKALGGLGGGGGGFFSFLGSLFGGGGGSLYSGASAAAVKFHQGGMRGDRSASAFIHPAYYENAPRFHDGKSPFGPGEFPAILKNDEEVLTADDPRHRWNGGGGGTSVSVALSVDARGSEKGSGEEIAATLKRFAESPFFKTKIVEAVREGRSRRQI